MPLSEYQKKLQSYKQFGKPKEEKLKYQLRKKSLKKLAEEAAEKEILNGDDTFKQKWFKSVRKKLVGICQCGCARKSSKNDDVHFRSSCCHVFPQAIFESVQYNTINFVERNFWEGCHTNMDNRGMDRWPMFADWDNIKEIFHQLAPLLTDKERATKFYTHLEKLVYSN